MTNLIGSLRHKGESFEGVEVNLGDLGDMDILPRMRMMRSAATNFMVQLKFEKGIDCLQIMKYLFLCAV